jgi:CheY-like chemotaxis protein
MPEPDDGFVLAGKLEEYGFDMDQFLLTSGELSAGELPEGIDIQFVPKGDLDGLKAWCGDHIEPYQHVRHKNNEMRTLLVIDDDELVRETFLTWVSHTFPTLEVETAETLEQVTESIGKVPSPYAVITDYDLGDFDANSVWKLLKESWGESKANEDIVVVSGLEREDIGSMSFIGKGNLQAISSWIEEKFY